jgi:hypothetical protein
MVSDRNLVDKLKTFLKSSEEHQHDHLLQNMTTAIKSATFEHCDRRIENAVVDNRVSGGRQRVELLRQTLQNCRRE